MLSPIYIVARALDLHPERVEGALEALRAAGWHLVSTPRLSETDERGGHDHYPFQPGIRLTLESTVDDGTVYASTYIHAQLLTRAESSDYRPWAERDLARVFIEALGHRLGVPGCKAPS